MKKLICNLVPFLFYCNISFAQYNYPAAKTVDSSDSYFGVTYKDPYRWLEDLKDSNVLGWFKEQKEFTDKTMKNIDGTDSLLNQVQSYMSAKTWGREPNHSHLINLNYIKRYIKGDGGQIELQNGTYVDVSRKKKDEFLKAIGY